MRPHIPAIRVIYALPPLVFESPKLGTPRGDVLLDGNWVLALEAWLDGGETELVWTWRFLAD